MEKVFFLEGLDGEILKRGLANRGKMLSFGIGGKFLGEGPINYNVLSNAEVDVISIINADNNLELASVMGNEFRKYNIKGNFDKVLMWLNYQEGLELSGVREGVIRGKRFNQYIYAYKKGVLNRVDMEGVMGLEIK